MRCPSFGRSVVEAEIEERLPLSLIDGLVHLLPLLFGLSRSSSQSREYGLLDDGLVLSRNAEQPMQIFTDAVDPGSIGFDFPQTVQIIVLRHFYIVPQTFDFHCEIFEYSLSDTFPILGSYIIYCIYL